VALLTYEELREEAAWNAETVPPNLAKLATAFGKFYGVDKVPIGVKGDNRHLNGYHRSRRWIRESVHCTSRTYSVTETDGNKSGGDDNWVSGMDLVLGRARTMSVAHALTMATQHGAIRYIRQIIVERDPWHVHMSFDRGHANDDHEKIFRVVTGTYSVEESLMDVKLALPLLRKASHGGYVLTAQYLLGARGFPTKPDGEFGDDTDKQTRAMQRKYNAEKVDGLWGPETWTIAVTGADKI